MTPTASAVTVSSSRRITRAVRVCLMLLFVLPYGSTIAAEQSLIEYSLKDQFNNRHTQQQALGKVVLIIGSDGEGSEFNDGWGTAINQAVADHPSYSQLHQLPYADLRGVPFFAKGYVRGMMPEAPENWVLMDWKGNFAKAYEFQPGATNILIFGTDTRLKLHESGQQVEAEKLTRLTRELIMQLDTLSN